MKRLIRLLFVVEVISSSFGADLSSAGSCDFIPDRDLASPTSIRSTRKRDQSISQRNSKSSRLCRPDLKNQRLIEHKPLGEIQGKEMGEALDQLSKLTEKTEIQEKLKAIWKEDQQKYLNFERDAGVGSTPSTDDPRVRVYYSIKFLSQTLSQYKRGAWARAEKNTSKRILLKQMLVDLLRTVVQSDGELAACLSENNFGFSLPDQIDLRDSPNAGEERKPKNYDDAIKQVSRDVFGRGKSVWIKDGHGLPMNFLNVVETECKDLNQDLLSLQKELAEKFKPLNDEYDSIEKKLLPMNQRAKEAFLKREKNPFTVEEQNHKKELEARMRAIEDTKKEENGEERENQIKEKIIAKVIASLAEKISDDQISNLTQLNSRLGQMIADDSKGSKTPSLSELKEKLVTHALYLATQNTYNSYSLKHQPKRTDKVKRAMATDPSSIYINLNPVQGAPMVSGYGILNVKTIETKPVETQVAGILSFRDLCLEGNCTSASFNLQNFMSSDQPMLESMVGGAAPKKN